MNTKAVKNDYDLMIINSSLKILTNHSPGYDFKILDINQRNQLSVDISGALFRILKRNNIESRKE